MINEKIKGYLLVARPYSFVDIALVAVLANVIARGELLLDSKLVLDALVALLWWSSLLFIGEMRKNKDISVTLSFTLLTLLTIIIAVQNPLSTIFLLASIFFLFTYSKKSKSKFFGLISPINRGILTVLLFFIVLSTHNTEITLSFFYSKIILAVFLSVVSRSIIGDIRDWTMDLYTFPRQYGIKIGFIASAILIIAILSILPNILIVFPLMVLLFFMLIYKQGYLIHRFYILASTFFLMNLILSLSGIPMIFSNLLFLAVVLNITYDFVPRTLKLKKGLASINASDGNVLKNETI